MRPTTDLCPGFLRHLPTRREAVRAGALTLTGLGLPGLFQARAPAAGDQLLSIDRVWSGQGVHPDLPVGRSQPARHLGPEARRPGGDPRRIPADLDPHARRSIANTSHSWRGRRTVWPIVRSMSHDDPAHLSTAHRVLTGHLAPTPVSDAAGPSPNDWPHLGAIVAKVRPSRGVLPSSVTMPWTVAHPAAPGGRAPGQDAGWLGKAYDPFRVEGDPNAPNFRVAGLDLPEGVSPRAYAIAAPCSNGWPR